MNQLTRLTNSLTSRQALPRNLVVTPPKNLSVVRNAPQPSNLTYGRPRSIKGSETAP